MPVRGADASLMLYRAELVKTDDTVWEDLSRNRALPAVRLKRFSQKILQETVNFTSMITDNHNFLHYTSFKLHWECYIPKNVLDF